MLGANIKKGQTVWFTDYVIYRGRGLVEGTVKSSGTRYIVVTPNDGLGREFKFWKDSLQGVSKTGISGRLYPDKVEYEAKEAYNEDLRYIKKELNTIGIPRMTPDKVRRIRAIIEEDHE